jgi:hypothetical protein
MGKFFIRFQFRQVPMVTNGFNSDYIHYKSNKSIINGHTGMPNMGFISKNEFFDIFGHFFHMKKWLCRKNVLGYEQDLFMLFPKHPFFLLIGITSYDWKLACQNQEI